MPKIRVELEVPIEVPRDCRECDHRYGNTCTLFDRELTSYGNVGDVDWGYIRCDECKQAEVDIPNGEECSWCQALVPPTYYSRDYVCKAFNTPVECFYDFNPKGYYERHIYKCKQCLNAEVEE